MQPYRIVSTRSIPRVCKASTPTRTMFTTPFFPHFNTLGSDFAPLFRLLDSATADLVPSSRQQARRTFTPRFDVREIGASYELQGEMPGLERKDLDIEFLDDRTLVIRGRTGIEATKTNEAAEAAEPARAVDNEAANDNVSEKSASYQKASVEDEYVDAGAESEAAEGAKTPASTAAEVAPTAETKKAAEPSFKYWVSERSVGEFERRFSFPGRVELENVKASLSNGILSVVVPKVLAKDSRRINIE
ncbi:hypothetical protein HO173_006087 [Letharia columbiana]|uniref:SHSP domain-containing protein n=1 Tax=Letharia columbiana TaxID=112416 RepID=A0A8H6FW58_9LECA|nr:uncharacterized protein HO173_006087 [Letharia columbiana]KAF6235891.1 hypothetical protein HO173_006087 [Letharia columbiana]